MKNYMLRGVVSKIEKKNYQFIQQPRSGEDQWNVSDHVNHRSPVDVKTGDIVILCDDIGDNRILYPLHCIRHRIKYEQY